MADASLERRLLTAAEANDFEGVRDLLDEGADANYQLQESRGWDEFVVGFLSCVVFQTPRAEKFSRRTVPSTTLCRTTM
jgi:hypothetical protein